MQPIDVKKRTIGVNLSSQGAAVNVWSPLAQTVSVVVGEVEMPLKKTDDGYWMATSDKLGEGTRYRLKKDGGPALPDPTSLSQPDGVHGDSEIIHPTSFSWSKSDWKNIPLADYILYELHVGTFSEEGTFEGVVKKLDHLKNLGVTAIEIMPVAQFPGDRNWGYDGVFPFAVQGSYGGAEGLQRLIDACHQKGLAVILDVVYNHVGPEGAYFNSFGPYFTHKYNTPWGDALNFDDEWCDGVRRFFIENALMWFRDFHVDALRLDAVHAIKDFSATHILQELRLRVNELMQATGKRHYLMVELDLNDARFATTQVQGGYGMDAQWADEFHHALRVAAGGSRTGYYADFSGIGDLAKAYRDAYVYDGQWSPHRNKHFGIKADALTGEQLIVFSQNHDQVGNRILGERTSTLVSLEMQKLLAAAVIVSPFLPLLFMGEEWGETNPFQYFVSHTDAELAEAVLNGRRAEFDAFHAQGEAPDPMAVETFLQSRLQWSLPTKEGHRTLLAYYKSLITFRKTHPALKTLNRKNLTIDCDVQKNCLLLTRWQGSQTLCCALNFSAKSQTVSLQGQRNWQLVFASSATEWAGNGDAQLHREQLSLPAESIVILQATA